MIDLAQEINGEMPGYVVERACEILGSTDGTLAGTQVLLLGVTYKEDVADQRESPADHVVRHLRRRGASVSYHDPYIGEWVVDGLDVARVDDLHPAMRAADLTIVLQWHAHYREQLNESQPGLLFDTKGWLSNSDVAVL